jgi:hypothetical protein
MKKNNKTDRQRQAMLSQETNLKKYMKIETLLKERLIKQKENLVGKIHLDVKYHSLHKKNINGVNYSENYNRFLQKKIKALSN